MGYLDEYFEFIGVKNKGWKRIILILLIGFILFCIFYWFYLDIESGKEEALLSQDTYQDAKNYIVITCFVSIILFSVLMRLLSWIREGFKEH